MVRRVTFLFLLVAGILCLLNGKTLERGWAADNKCADAEPDLSVYCPVQVGDDPNLKCNNAGYNSKELCDGMKNASSFYMNYSYTKFSKGSYPQLQFDSIIPPVPSQKLCYKRTYCSWDGTKCTDGKSEFVYQLYYVKTACP
jgi:hypothetical protein